LWPSFTVAGINADGRCARNDRTAREQRHRVGAAVLRPATVSGMDEGTLDRVADSFPLSPNLLDIDPLDAAESKLQLNAKKHPLTVSTSDSALDE
jgi:hypothetical protein